MGNIRSKQKKNKRMKQLNKKQPTGTQTRVT